MKFMAIAGILITLPAIVVILWFTAAMQPAKALPAVASLLLNSLPFVVAILLIRHAQRRGKAVEDFEH